MIIKSIQNWFESRVDRKLARATRIHALQSDASLFIKREDELSSGIAGSKLRKYASLLPYLTKNGVTEVALIGGPNSNNLVGLLQVLKEHGILAWLFIRKAADSSKQGNALFLDMLAPRDSTFLVEREQWQDVEKTASSFLRERESTGVSTFLIPEGALCYECLAGAMTLAEDLLKNEERDDSFHKEVYIDSGTGMSAIGLLLGLGLLDAKLSERKIHITLIAGSSEEFEKHLEAFKNRLCGELSRKSLPLPCFDFLHPPTARKFGAVNKSLITACRDIARNEGILMDPTYSVKHYMAMREHRKSQTSSTDPALFIYNGSALGLAGFQEQLKR